MGALVSASLNLRRHFVRAATQFNLVLAAYRWPAGSAPNPRLADVDFELIQRTVATHDLDTVALLCRGANFDRALFVTLAINLDGKDRGLIAAEEFGKLYESVPVMAAQRALRFWKVRDAA